jgi:hypothetical protein
VALFNTLRLHPTSFPAAVHTSSVPSKLNGSFDDNSTSAPHGPQLLGKRIQTTDGPTQLETECEQVNANENP